MIPHIGNGELASVAGRRSVVQAGIPLFRLSLPRSTARSRSFVVVVAGLGDGNERRLANGAFAEEPVCGRL